MRRPEDTDEAAEDRLLDGDDVQAATASAAIDARYGRTARDRRGQRVLAWGAAIAIVLIFGVWTLWRFLGAGATEIETTVIGFDTISETEIRVTGQVNFDRDATATCVVEALGAQKQIVGWVEVELGPAESPVRPVSELVRTSERAVTGLISRCTVP